MPRDAFEGIYDLALAAAYVRAAMKDAAEKSEQRENRKIYGPIHAAFHSLDSLGSSLA